MPAYDSIASVYDNINSEIDYSAWADFIEESFKKYLPAKPELVLDLACGTGSMTLELHTRGYDMIGADMSEDMLSQAYEKAYDKEISGVLFLKQDMRCFELYGTVGAVVCCLDSVNYLTADGDLDKCFACVHNYLDPDGLFIFDVNSPHKFENVYGNNAYVLEDEGVYCGWQNEYDRQSGVCDFYLSLFEETEDGTYERSDEHHRERCYSLDDLKNTLDACRLETLGVFSDFDFNEIKPDSDRWYIVARAKK